MRPHDIDMRDTLASVLRRLTALERLPSLSGRLVANVLRLNGTQDLSPSSTGHPFQIGPDNGLNLRMDPNEVMAASNGSPGTLNLNADGGTVTVGTNTPGTLRVRGSLSIAGDDINGQWTQRTPTWAQGITVGNGTHFVRWKRVGTTVFEIGRFTFGSTSSMSASSQPVLFTPATIAASDGVKIIGSASYFDSTTGRFLPGIIRAWTGISVTFHGTNGNAILAGNPFTWGSGNSIAWTLAYEVDPSSV